MKWLLRYGIAVLAGMVLLQSVSRETEPQVFDTHVGDWRENRGEITP